MMLDLGKFPEPTHERKVEPVCPFEAMWPAVDRIVESLLKEPEQWMFDKKPKIMYHRKLSNVNFWLKEIEYYNRPGCIDKAWVDWQVGAIKIFSDEQGQLIFKAMVQARQWHEQRLQREIQAKIVGQRVPRRRGVPLSRRLRLMWKEVVDVFKNM